MSENNEIRQIAQRLVGLRDALDLTAEEVAAKINVPVNEYARYESGDSDIPMSVIFSVARVFGVETAALLSGNDTHHVAYSVVRNGKGVSVERSKAYKYQSLSGNFKNPNGEPFLVTVEPKPDSEPMHLNTHDTQEFNLILEGRLLLQIDGKDITLDQGDSIYFDARRPHGMKALDGKNVRFLAIIL
ncbi:MAG: helix-turn-helix transcriptional regulator [Paludibacteraceae bacterium]|nr:helix-turn-helix transcriptional regulator [Paludibacteraceae bacterium]